MATYDLTQEIPSSIKTGDILNCPYSGQAISLPLKKGIYKLECWGGQGGNGSGRSSSGNTTEGGKGGYSKGNINLKSDNMLYLLSGGKGTTKGGGNSYTTLTGGFNGGGDNYTCGSGGAGGGGTDVRINQNSLYARVIVAGGGAGTGWEKVGGAGGGTSSTTNGTAGVATQTSGGTRGTTSYNKQPQNGTFGVGGLGSGNSEGGSGGGGGWYGGGGDGYSGGGSGGSGYVYTSSTASNYPSGCLLDGSMYLEEAETIAGNQTFLSPSGTNETGHSGDGYIRITVIKAGAEYRGKKLEEPEPDYHITDDLTLTTPVEKKYRILRNNLIYDRTQGDVVTAYNLPDNIEYNKGNYNYTDLNRVEMWCEYMKDLITKLGFGVSTTTFKTDWKIGDLPSKEELDRIKNNIIEIRKSYFTFTDTPTAESLNVGKNKMNFEEANNMEKIIYDLFLRLYASRQLPRKCGVFKLGQNFIWQQRFRYFKSWDTILVETFEEFDENDILDLISSSQLRDKPITFNATATVEGNINFLNDYYETIDQVTGDIYGGDSPKYYWFNGDYKSLLQKTLGNHGTGVVPPSYEGNTPELEGYDYALYGYYDDDDEELDLVTQQKYYEFDDFISFVPDPLVPKDLDDVEGTIKVASYISHLTPNTTDVVPIKPGYIFDGWENIVDEDTHEVNLYNFKPKWR